MDNTNKKQLQRALEAKELSTQGTKADLELRLKERLELEGKDAAEFYLEVQTNGKMKAYVEKKQPSLNDVMAFLKERMKDQMTKMNDRVTELLIERKKFLKEQTKQNTQMKEQLSKQITE